MVAAASIIPPVLPSAGCITLPQAEREVHHHQNNATTMSLVWVLRSKSQPSRQCTTKSWPF